MNGTTQDPVLTAMKARNRRYYEGEQAGRDAVAAGGVDAARSALEAALPPGQPCTLSIEDYRYWSGYRAAILGA